MITIFINGQSQEVPEGLTLAVLLERLHIPADRVAVERNLEIVRRDQWGATTVEAGDRLEVVQFVGGGSDAGSAGVRSPANSARACVHSIFRKNRLSDTSI